MIAAIRIVKFLAALVLVGGSFRVGEVYAIAVGQVDDFSSNLEGWTQGQEPFGGFGLTRQTGGGPAGDGDAYMQIASHGAGSLGRMIAFNVSSDWSGDYRAAGVTSVSMDVRNAGATDLMLRLAFGASTIVPMNPGQWVASADPVLVPAGSGWTNVQFPIDAVNLASVPGNPGTFDQVMSQVQVIRLLHSSVVNHRGDFITATLGVDNMLVNGLSVGIPGDFDGNEVVDGADLEKWKMDFGGGGGSDADGDLDTDGADFLVWQRNFGQAAGAAVPEPAAGVVALGGALALLSMRRRRV